jgi:hypothetical protein
MLWSRKHVAPARAAAAWRLTLAAVAQTLLVARSRSSLAVPAGHGAGLWPKVLRGRRVAARPPLPWTAYTAVGQPPGPAACQLAAACTAYWPRRGEARIGDSRLAELAPRAPRLPHTAQ